MRSATIVNGPAMLLTTSSITEISGLGRVAGVGGPFMESLQTSFLSQKDFAKTALNLFAWSMIEACWLIRLGGTKEMIMRLKTPFRFFRFGQPLLLGVGLVLASRANAADAGNYKVDILPLPGATAAGVSMDYIAFDPATRYVWAPAGNTGVVVIVDSTNRSMKQISGFPTAEVGSGDRKRVVGPSSVTVGEGVVYVGNRGDSSVCSFDARSLANGACHKLDSMPDGLAYVASQNEVWVTTPRDKSIRVLDGKTLEEKTKFTLDGGPEGFAVDAKRHWFYTNLEDKDLTLAIDVASRKTVATWKPSCGEEGPRGLRVDANAGHLFVACTAKVKVLDAAHGGEELSSVDTGEGVDDIDYAPSTHVLYAPAAKAGQLTIAKVDVKGKLTVEAKVPTHVGARNPAVTDKGVVYLAHSGAGGLTGLVVVTPK
jgi:DNA-binding beta-propeller fold protein YncE